MKCTRYLNLVSLCLSDGGIGYSSETSYMHFTNKSRVLLELFKKEIRKFTSSKIHEQKKPRGITLRVFDKNLISELIKISPSFRTKSCNHFPVCPYLKSDKINLRFKHTHVKSDGFVWSEIKIPENLFQNKKDKSEFLKIYISCDGYPSIFPRKDSWSAVERIVAIVCHHPILKQRLSELLDDLKVPHNVKENSLEMRSREAIIKFKKEIGFVNGVEMTGNSRYWEGLTKNKVLNKIIKSYDTKFDSRNTSYVINKIKQL